MIKKIKLQKHFKSINIKIDIDCDQSKDILKSTFKHLEDFQNRFITDILAIVPTKLTYTGKHRATLSDEQKKANEKKKSYLKRYLKKKLRVKF